MTVLLPAPQDDISRWRQLRVFLTVQPLALIAPGRVADFGVVPLLKGQQAPGTLAGTVLVDKLVTLVYLGLAAPVAVRYLSLESASSQTAIAGPLLILLVGLASAILVNSHVRSWVNRHILRRWPALLAGFGAHLEFLMWTSRLRLGMNLAITVCKVICVGLTLMFLSQNVNVALGFAEAVCLGVLLQVVTMVPISIMGLGIGEAALAALFSVMGHPESAAISVMLVARVLFCGVLAAIYFTVSVPVMEQKYGRRERRGTKVG